MHALVFAAGRGSRLRPYTDETPKPLLEVAGEPMLVRLLRSIADAGIEEITVVVGYGREAIVDRVGDSLTGTPITYAVQHERKGLAHALYTALEDGYGVSLPRLDVRNPSLPPLPESVPENVLTVNGDNVFEDCDLSRFVERHCETDVDGTLLLDRVSRNEAETTARCVLDDDGTIRSIEASTDGAQPGYVAGGVQTHDTASLLEACLSLERADSGEYELAEALESLTSRNRYVGIELEGWHLNVNTPADLERARRRLDSV
ncbi:nucleotidyltransferase family protein [Natronobacterium texcoconense]|uniref:Glucose-1-phosphate thymidylyltransferase n=1 Tax=Natronobacterium texcoconense TaxID=1095778 RepID=A0A1H1H0G7_NATTX|nr:nucleotidyltransferase family protein [Natronobacterium texcoconense]SDR18910.1 glucose-1-phosphate thymidylyltransferase [Natronobacterium texcoconense]